MGNLKRITLFDIRHYSRDKKVQPQYQLPSFVGRWEMEQLALILNDMGIDPAHMAASVQPRAFVMSDLIGFECGWNGTTVRYLEFNDIKSDPRAKKDGIIDAVKAFKKASEVPIPTETALLLEPRAREYMWKRSEEYLLGLRAVAKKCEDGETATIFSHGGQVEMRFMRLQLTVNNTPFSEQTLEMIDIANLEEFGGMLRTGEGFSYDLLVSANGNIVRVENLNTIRLPEIPAELKG